MDLGQIFDTIKHYLDPRTLAAAGHVVLILIVFAETGLAAGFFLPGDSLLVVAGLFAAKGDLNLTVLLISLFIAAVVGDAVGYYTGHKLGPLIFSRPKSLLFHPDHLKKAKAFYDKYGGKTIIIARFLPIVRTFAPIVAGVANMSYPRFAAYNVIGGAVWVGSMILSGYFLGHLIPNLDQHIEKLVVIVVFLSFIPIIIEGWKARREAQRDKKPPAAPPSSSSPAPAPAEE